MPVRAVSAGAGAVVGGAVLVSAVLASAVLVACSAPPRPTFYQGGGVRVSATLGPASTSSSTRLLRVRFAPVAPGYHLYSITMAANGVDGLGIPTRVSVSGSLRAAGPASTDVAPHPFRIQGLGVSLPVYPDGPVTVSVPVRLTASGQPSVTVGYGACNATRCLIPVRRAVLAVSDQH